jgi:hypothetical protein
MDALFERVEFEKIKGEELRAILLKASYECEQIGLKSEAIGYRIKASLLVDGRNYVAQTRISYHTLDEYTNHNDYLLCNELQERLRTWKKENEKNETV